MGECLTQLRSDVPGLLSTVEAYLHAVQRHLWRLRVLYYTACLVLVGYLVCLVQFMHMTALAELIAIPLFLLFLLLAAWPAHRLRDLREEQAHVAHLQQALLPVARVTAAH